MEVIQVIRNGICETPILIKDPQTAEATWEGIARDLLEEDFEELPIGDNKYDQLNRMLEYSGVEVHFWTDLEINEYVNE